MKNILFSVVSIFVQLIALYFIKYSNQNLPLSAFNFSFIGNIFLLVVYLFIIAGLIFNLNKGGSKSLTKSINLYLLLTWILLVLAFISTKTDLGLNSIYLFGQAGNRLFSGLLYTIFILALFSFLIHLWSHIFSKGKYSVLNSIYRSMLMLLIFLLLTFIYTNTIGYTSKNWQLNKNNGNVAAVLGAAVWSGNLPSPTLSGRIDKALDLVNNGFAGKVLVTGGSAPGEMAEAEVAFNYLMAKGIDSSIVSIETITTSTTEQVQFIKKELIDSEKAIEIIVISDSYHLPRVIEISKFYNAEIKVAESKHLLDFKDKLYNKTRESVALFIFWCFAL